MGCSKSSVRFLPENRDKLREMTDRLGCSLNILVNDIVHQSDQTYRFDDCLARNEPTQGVHYQTTYLGQMLSTLWVRPDLRRRGVAKAVLKLTKPEFIICDMPKLYQGLVYCGYRPSSVTNLWIPER